MNCPKDNAKMQAAYIDRKDHKAALVWVCPKCYHETRIPTSHPLKLKYLCAFCHERYSHVQTEDHTPLATLVCPHCAKKMGLELQTHPDNPEDAENPYVGC
jgi:uncharacterized protein (DUF983 family)